MKIDCIADLHGHYPKLEGGDLLIVAGDLTKSDAQYQYLEFREWMQKQKYKKKVFICGNHDGQIENGGFYFSNDWMGAEYLCDSGTEFEGLKIWGSPWTKRFEGMNPNCTAFTVETDEELAEKWKSIPDHIDILIAHGPPHGVLDEVKNFGTGKIGSVGSISLKNRIDKILPEMVLFGHIHECGGQYVSKEGILYINGSIVNEKYRVSNNGRRINFDEKMPKMQRFKVVE